MSDSNTANPLASILTPTDNLAVDESGNLLIEARSARSLIDEFGSPLYVISEKTLRDNFRRIRRAFETRWPTNVNVLYAIKANNNLAVGAVLDQEGAGGDCFGLGELHATFAGGADPNKVVMNGTNKSVEELRAAAQLGVRVNIDAEEEIDLLRKVASDLGCTVRVNLRVKITPPTLDNCGIDFGGTDFSMHKWIEGCQWGLSVDTVARLVPIIQAAPELVLDGYHLHIGRASNEPSYCAAWAAAMAEAIVDLRKRTGFEPAIIDLGGGYARQRDGESGSLEMNHHTIDQYAEAVTQGLLGGLQNAGLPIPELWIEPGRYIAGNAGLLLGTVGAIKRDLGKTWVNIDFSINHIMRVFTSGWKYHLLMANRMLEPHDETADIVGSICLGNPISPDLAVPHLVRGDLIAALDAGMYAEVASTQMNGVPRPATVLVNGTDAEIIKERESVLDVFSRYRLPPRLSARTNQPHD